MGNSILLLKFKMENKHNSYSPIATYIEQTQLSPNDIKDDEQLNIINNINSLRDGLYKLKDNPYSTFLEKKKENFIKLKNEDMNDIDNTKESLFITGVSAISTNPIRTCNPEAFRNKNYKINN